ncbi:phage tail tape measure C-terminal domain-containing protein [Nitrogeniibacter aestuarii]|uniref:phage tail tape measure C-terminal domain-containing protein n=1 Tax=Nitrogeniibacter aestuarii TaxID=2815343 RepID=UPI001D12065B|nr:phage tail tape measure C-terminal domain-containing protein [Nitrogeniibacter aestuarii]
MSSAFDAVKSSFGAAFAGLGTGVAFKTFAVDVSAAGVEVERLSSIANASANDFQRMAYGAESVGVPMEKYADILRDVNDKVGEFVAVGGGPLKDFFDNIAPKVGIAADEFARLSGPEALQAYYDALEKAGLNQQQMTFYLEALASDTTALIPLLRDGGRGFAEMGQYAEKVGRVLSDDLVSSSVEFQQNIRELEGAMVGLRNTIGAEVLPTLNRLANEFLLGMQYSDGFLDALTRYGFTNPFEDMAGKLVVLRNEFEQIDFRLSNNRSEDRTADEERMRRLEQEIGYYTKMLALRDRISNATTLPAIAASGTHLPQIGSITKSKNKPDEDTLGDFASDQVEEFDQRLADLRDRYVDLIDPVQRYRDEIEQIRLLNEEGYLNDDQALEAEFRIQEAMDETLDKIGEVGKAGTDRFEDLTKAIDSWGNQAADTFAEFVVTGKASFGDLVNSILMDIARLQAKKLFDPIVQQGGDVLTQFAKGLFGPSSGSSGSLQSFSGGGVATGPSSGYLAALHGTEAVIPVKDGAIPVRLSGAMGGGSQVFVNVTNNAGGDTRASASSSTDQSGNVQLEIIVERVEGRMGQRMRGGGGLAPLIESRYGLNPANGAMR